MGQEGPGEGAKAELPLGLAPRGKEKLMLQPSGEKPAVRIPSGANSGGVAGDVKGWWKETKAHRAMALEACFYGIPRANFVTYSGLQKVFCCALSDNPVKRLQTSP